MLPETAGVVFGRPANQVPERFTFRTQVPYGYEITPELINQLFTEMANTISDYMQTALMRWTDADVSSGAGAGGAQPAIALEDYTGPSGPVDPPTVRVKVCDLDGSNPSGDTLTVSLPYSNDVNDVDYGYPNVRADQVISVASYVDSNGDTKYYAVGPNYLQAPIGSLWLTTQVDNVPVGWERYATGRFLVGYDENDSDYSCAGKTGGYKTHGSTENGHSDHATHSDHHHYLCLNDGGHTHSVSLTGSHDHAADGLTSPAHCHNAETYACVTTGASEGGLKTMSCVAVCICGCTAETSITLEGASGSTTVTVAGDTETQTGADHNPLDLDHDAHDDSDNRPKFITVAIYRRVS